MLFDVPRMILYWHCLMLCSPFFSPKKYRDTILRFGGERRPTEMLANLVIGNNCGEGEGAQSSCSNDLEPERLARGLCEDIESSEETARLVHHQAEESGWKLVR